MKIISNSSDAQPEKPEPIQVPIEVVLTPASEATPRPVAPALEASVSETLLSEIHTLQEKFEQTRSRLTDQMLQNTRQVAKLSEEITALRETLEHIKTPTLSEPASPLKSTLIEPSSGSSLETPPITVQVAEVIKEPTAVVNPLPLLDPTERKVAFFAKLWDYLNQTAFEIPLHKSNRTD